MTKIQQALWYIMNPHNDTEQKNGFDLLADGWNDRKSKTAVKETSANVSKCSQCGGTGDHAWGGPCRECQGTGKIVEDLRVTCQGCSEKVFTDEMVNDTGLCHHCTYWMD